MNVLIRFGRICSLACLLCVLFLGGARAETELPYSGKTAVAYVSSTGENTVELMLYSEKQGERTLLVFQDPHPLPVAEYEVQAASKGSPFTLTGLHPAQRYTAVLVIHDASAEKTEQFPYFSPASGYAVLSFSTEGLSAPEDTVLTIYNITATSAHIIAFTAKDVTVRLTLLDQEFWLRNGRGFLLTRMEPDHAYQLTFAPMRCPCDSAVIHQTLRTLQEGQGGLEPRPKGKEGSPKPAFHCLCGNAERCAENGCLEQMKKP